MLLCMAVHSFIRQFSWLIQRPVQPISIHAGVPLLPHPRFRFFSQSATPESVHGQVTVSCDADGRKMTVRWADGEQNVFHAVWLRHSCQCSECVQQSSGQRLVTSSVLGAGLRISKAKVQGGMCMVADIVSNTTQFWLVYTLSQFHLLWKANIVQDGCAHQILSVDFNWSIELAFHDSDSKFKNRLLDRQPEIYCPIFYYPHFQPTLPSVDHMAAINVVQLRAYDTFLIMQ